MLKVFRTKISNNFTQELKIEESIKNRWCTSRIIGVVVRDGFSQEIMVGKAIVSDRK